MYAWCKWHVDNLFLVEVFQDREIQKMYDNETKREINYWMDWPKEDNSYMILFSYYVFQQPFQLCVINVQYYIYPIIEGPPIT